MVLWRPTRPSRTNTPKDVLLIIGDWNVKVGSQEIPESEVIQSCPTLCNLMDCSLPGSSVHGIFQARTLEWVAISFSRRSSQPRDWTQVSRIVGRHFAVWATWEIRGRDAWSNRQIWPWSTKWSRAKANRVFPREPTGHSEHPLPKTQEKTLHMDITRWSIPKSYWLHSLQPHGL